MVQGEEERLVPWSALQTGHTTDIDTLERVCNNIPKYNSNIEIAANRMKMGGPAPNLYLLIEPYQAIYLPYLYYFNWTFI